MILLCEYVKFVPIIKTAQDLTLDPLCTKIEPCLTQALDDSSCLFRAKDKTPTDYATLLYNIDLVLRLYVPLLELL